MSWGKADRLAERRRDQVPEAPDARAARRLARWQRRPGFADAAVFAAFLEDQGLTERELLGLLREPAADAPEPAWTGLYRAGAADACGPGPLRLLAPLIAHYQARLPAAGELLLPVLLPRLERLITKTLVLETNIARLRGELSGDSPEARYQDFLGRLGEPAVALGVLRQYPVLARRSVACLEHWLTFSREFLQRLAADQGHHGPLTAVSGAAGDAHRQGRAVLVCTFASGTRLVYKPRPLAAERVFYELVQRLNDQGAPYALQAVPVQDRGAYGWCDFIPFSACADAAQVRRFYERQGAWIALLYALGATDFHLENIIAAGEHPMLVDLETLFHPRLFTRPTATADALAYERLVDSVMALGLLPAPVHAEGRTMDTSGLGARPDQVTPFLVDGLADLGKDTVRVAKTQGRLGAVHSRPTLAGRAVELAEHRDQVETGFVAMYRFLAAHQTELMAPDGWLAAFQDVPLRAVLRPSAQYAALLSESHHPQMLRDGLDQELLFGQLWGEAARTPAYRRVAGSERRQLLDGDIPYFSTTAKARSLTGADGTDIPEVLAKSGWEVAEERWARLGPHDLARQLWLLKAALATSGRAARTRRQPLPRAAPRAMPLAAAQSLGDHLLATAIETGGAASWLTLKHATRAAATGDALYNLGLIHDDLYSGLPGVILFLAYLAALAPTAAYDRLARAALATVEARDASATRALPGAFNGVAGLVYLYTHLAALWRDGRLAQKAAALLPALAAAIARDQALDVIGGSAGCIPVLLGAGATDLARLCGEQLLAASRQVETPDGRGRFWPSLHVPRGFSHGHAGIAWALARLGQVTASDVFKRAALEAVAYERMLLAQGGWSDLAGDRHHGAWCHGAPGIAMGRLAAYQALGEPALRRDAEVALAELRGERGAAGHILCHGALGNLEALQLAAAVLPDQPEWAAELATRRDALLIHLGRRGWDLPQPLALAEPGLMMGVAGAGFGLLRMAAPARVPAVLLLEAPRPSS